MSSNLRSNTKKKYVLLFTIIAFLFTMYSLVTCDIPVDKLKNKYAGPTSRFITINGMDVHYRDQGRGIPIVLIHGTGASLHTWNDWTSGLQGDYRIIRMDLPAFGLTGPHPKGNYSIEGYTTFINNFLTKLKIDTCYLVGNSLGGNIAWNYTSDYPDRVKKLILIDASGYSSNRKKSPWAFRLARTPVLNAVVRYVTPRSLFKKNLEAVYFDDQKITEELIDRYYDMMLREGNRQAFIDRVKMPAVTDIDKLKTIKTETLVIWGADDEWIPVSNGQKFVRDLPNAKLVVIEDTGHVPMEESPEESLQVVLDFFKSE